MQEFLINAQRICAGGRNTKERSVPEPLTDQQAGAFPLFIMGLCSFSSVSHDRFLNAFMFASAV